MIQRNWQTDDYYVSPLSLALGSFDAIHYGHQDLLKEKIDSLERWVLYFRLAPQALRQTTFQGMVRSEAQRLEIFANLGLDGALSLDFSPEISKMNGIDFLEELYQKVAMKQLIIGEDFRLGKGAQVTHTEIKAWAKTKAINVSIHPLRYEAGEGDKYSSSTLREAVLSRNFALIEATSGYGYAIDLRHLDCYQAEGAWHYRLESSEQVLPPDGRYQTVEGIEIVKKEGLLVSAIQLEQAFL
ncbi:hypothetical protein [Entomospira culicis]|uniref:FAD synthase n=1 Tax=Entomospira culicis TaxID=2719989 RepID=A0A968KZ48_9SPIO|nr:hypothetical protein [Entomospira culicis]NIZ18731.1 hypothetical protein [Entomospira culicis]NIZ68946.1 hypothetical protein [Entomospira culicis]WDI37538.1 hypothetical protein PVA46_01755 [Entomospira culicis]WDI39166.1 hypothetical protein PVA47_01760 [Entomospira culicis]